MIGKVIGNYAITSKLAEGGMGAVYRGKHLNLPREVVIKCILLGGFSQGTHALLKARFLREACLQSQLDHPNIVRVYEFFVAEENHYLVMEYVAGMSLADLLKQRGRLTEFQAIQLFKQALSGMDYAHHFSWQDEKKGTQAGIVHRDIKPGNMLLDGQARLKITDFGIARIESENTLTQSGFNPGTVAYMSPEQLGGLRLDARSDIYSLGVTFYEMLAGRLPFVASTPGSDYEIRKGHVELDPPALMEFVPEISPELNAIVMRSLSKSPEARYQSALEFLEAIQRYEESVSGKRVTDGAMETIRKTVLGATPADTARRVNRNAEASLHSRAVSDSNHKSAVAGTQATHPRVQQAAAPRAPMQVNVPLETTSFRRAEPVAQKGNKGKAIAAGAVLMLLLVAAAVPLIRSRKEAEPVAGNAVVPTTTIPEMESRAAEPAPSVIATPTPGQPTTDATAKAAPSPEGSPTPSASPGNAGTKPMENAIAAAELKQAQEHESQERYREAITAYENYLQTYPGAPNTSVVSGKLGQLRQFYGTLTTATQELTQRDYEGAERDFKQAIALKPDSRLASSGYEEARTQLRRQQERAASEAEEASRRQQRSGGQPVNVPPVQIGPPPAASGFPSPGKIMLPPPPPPPGGPGPRRP